MKKHSFIFINTLGIFILLSVLPVKILSTPTSDEEIRALEKQIEQKESEQAAIKKKAAEEAQRKAEEEAKRMAEEEAQRKAEEEEQLRMEEKRKADLENQKAMEEENRRLEEEASKKAEEEKRQLELEKEKEEKEKQRIVQSILGKWQSDYGKIDFSEPRPGEIEGTYTYLFRDGKLTGSLEGNTLHGYWLQNGGLKSCSEERDGTKNWGQISFQFINEYSEFTGKWGYCNDEPGDSWNGKKL